MDLYFVFFHVPNALQSNQYTREDKILYFANILAFDRKMLEKFRICVNLMADNLLYFVILYSLDLLYFIRLPLAWDLCQSLWQVFNFLFLII